MDTELPDRKLEKTMTSDGDTRKKAAIIDYATELEDHKIIP